MSEVEAESKDEIDITAWKHFKIDAPTDSEIGSLFQMFDRDQNNMITEDELTFIWRAVGQNPTRKEIKEMMTLADNDSSGFIDFHEFKTIMLERWKRDQEEEMVAAFALFDRNHDGFIDKQELKYVVTHCGDDKLTEEEAEEVIQMMIFEADMNRDRKINYKEFARVICKIR